MSLKVKENVKYAVACPTSMGVRITPENRMAVQNSHMFYMQATSAETNVLNVSSSLGKRCLALTRFVEGSPVAKFIQQELGARNIAWEGATVPQGGPWGYRHQFNIADSGFGLRAPRVWNDRAGEVGRTLNIADFDIPRIFGEEGVGILHLSGLIAAMRPAWNWPAPRRNTARSSHSTSTTARPSGRAAKKNFRRRSPRSLPSLTSWSATRKTSSSAWASRARRPAARTLAPRSRASRA